MLSAGRRRTSADNDALILDVLREANKPLGAYEIAFRAVSCGFQIVPNQVYRTLARLIERDLVSRIETLNAYVARQSEGNLCLICKDCHMVEFIEVPSLRQVIVIAPGCQFDTVEGLIEAQGRCAGCHLDGHDS